MTDEKMQMMVQSYKRLPIEIILMNETNTKQTNCNQDKLQRKLKYLGRETCIVINDSRK